MVTIDNGRIRAEIDPMGAELRSVVMDGREYLWNGDPAFWPRRAPILFPVCGSCPGGGYTHDGREYKLSHHGYAKDTLFTVERQDDAGAGFLSLSDELTRGQYPFDYALRIGYGLDGQTLAASAEVTNTGDVPMWFSLGSHEGWACPGGLAACTLSFPQDETLTAFAVEDGRLTGETRQIALKDGCFPLDDPALWADGIFFRGMRSRSVTLRCGDGHGVTVSFADCDVLGLWTKPGAPYLCIEPWCGFFAPASGSRQLSAREGIQLLDAGDEFTACHQIRLF